MASRTQLRLGQITGSFGDAEGKIVDNLAVAATLGAIPAGSGSLVSVLSQFASAIKRINGGAAFSSQAAGEFNQDLVIKGTTPTLTIGDNGAEDVALVFDNGSQDYYMAVDHSDSQKLLIGLGSTVGSSAAITLDSSANVTFAGQISSSDKINVDDTTEATSTTDGSLQTDGGLSVAKSAVIGDDLDLLSNGAILNIGSDQKFTVTHANANNTATVSADNRLAFGNAADYIAGDGTDLKVVSSGDIDVTATLFDVTGAGQFSGNLTVGGNLDVNGTTTTIDTANLSIQDSIIALGVSGSDGGYSTTGERAILFTRGADHSFNAALFYDGTDFKFASTNTGPTSGSVAAPADAAAYITLRAGKIQSENTTEATTTTDGALQTDGGLSVAKSAVIGDDLDLLSNGAIFKVGNAQPFTLTHQNANNTATVSSNHRLAFGDAGEYISGDGTNLKVISSGDLLLDADGADIFFDDAGTRFGGISMISANNVLALSSSAGNNVALMSQGGSVLLANQDGSTAATFDLSTGNLIKILDTTDRARIEFDASSGDGFTQVSGSFQLDNGADPAEVIFKEAAANGSNTITLDIPAAVDSSYTITLPAANGSSGQVLKLSDGNGNLTFGDATGDLTKGIKIISSAVAAGAAVNFNSVDVGSTISGLSTAVTQGKSLDVFVNGQLLVSGSEAERAAGSRDYAIASGTELKFAFDLESDDVVQLIKR